MKRRFKYSLRSVLIIFFFLSIEVSIGSLPYAATAGARFSVSPKGVITDNKTGLEWLVGPDHDMTYSQAVKWVSACNVAGGGWQMPTVAMLKSLYQEGVGKRNMDPVFKTTGWYVWGKPFDSLSAWRFHFRNGIENWYAKSFSYEDRVFAVRPRK